MRVDEIGGRGVSKDLPAASTLDDKAALFGFVPQPACSPGKQRAPMSCLSQSFHQQQDLVLAATHLPPGINVQNMQSFTSARGSSGAPSNT